MRERCTYLRMGHVSFSIKIQPQTSPPHIRACALSSSCYASRSSAGDTERKRGRRTKITLTKLSQLNRVCAVNCNITMVRSITIIKCIRTNSPSPGNKTGNEMRAHNCIACSRSGCNWGAVDVCSTHQTPSFFIMIISAQINVHFGKPVKHAHRQRNSQNFIRIIASIFPGARACLFASHTHTHAHAYKHRASAHTIIVIMMMISHARNCCPSAAARGKFCGACNSTHAMKASAVYECAMLGSRGVSVCPGAFTYHICSVMFVSWLLLLFVWW